MTANSPLGTIIEDMPEAEYHARPEVSKHDLDMIKRAPLLYRYKKDNPDPPDEEINFGSLVHLAILQPHLLDDVVCYLPPDAPNKPSSRQINAKMPSPETTAAIAWWTDWREANKGKQEVTESMMEKVRGIQASVFTNPHTAIHLQTEQLREVSIFWERWGVKCRARLDILSACEIVDLKTCGDASRAGFAKEMGKRRYAHQGEHYIDGAKACGRNIISYVLIAVETSPPYLCAAHSLGDSSIEVAKSENRRDLATYKKCAESGVWPNIRNYNQPLEAPIWSFDE